jgi:hypothetical protein
LGIGYSLAGRRRITFASFLPLLGVQAFLFGCCQRLTWVVGESIP